MAGEAAAHVQVSPTGGTKGRCGCLTAAYSLPVLLEGIRHIPPRESITVKTSFPTLEHATPKDVLRISKNGLGRRDLEQIQKDMEDEA